MGSELNRGLAAIAYLPSATLAGADEASLASALAADDPRALRETWRRFQPMVARIALSATGSLPTAQALSRRIFRALILHLEAEGERDDETEGPGDGEHDGGVLTALLLSITAREVRRAVARARRRRWLGLRARAVPDLPLAGVDPFARQALVRFFLLLDRLGPLDRTAFSLRFFERREVHEVAEALGVPSARAERRLARSWRRLARAVHGDAAMADLIPTLAPDPDGEEGDELRA